MYTRQRHPLNNIFILILFGVLAGVAFLIYDNWQSEPATPAETDISATATAEPTPEVTETSVPAAAASNGEDAFADAEILIPAAGLYAPIIQVYLDGESWDVSNLGTNVGHLQGTNWMTDEPGNIVLSGHVELRDGRKGIFASVEDLAMGTTIILRRGSEQRSYIVTDLYRVEPDDLTPLYPTTEEQLTLITCDAYDFFQNEYQERVVVVAERRS